MRLKNFSDLALREEYERSRDNYHALVEINAELKNRDSDASFDLQLDVVSAINALRKRGKAASDSIARWIRVYLFRRNLSLPDGRPLHQYRMTDAEYAEANDILREAMPRLLGHEGMAARLFVVFGAEWFRRRATSMFLKWDDLAPDVFPQLPYKSKTILAELGLNYWRRELVKSEGGREFLLTLALEGGIPVNVIAEGGRGWLADYLRTLMRFALTSTNEHQTSGFAHDMSYMVRQSYRRDGFIDLCADLILKLIAWRRIAEDAPTGMDLVAFLDARDAGWKDSLPIYMPADHEPTARRLLNGLLAEKVGTIASSGIGAARYLTVVNGEWHPALILTANGEISAGKLPSISRHGRWKASPSGELANFLPSQFALFEPPTDEQPSWRVRAMRPLNKVLAGFPFNRSATVNLTTGSEVVPMTWPGGERISSDILVFLADEIATGNIPTRLRLIKTGSASLLAPTVYVLAPADWAVTPATHSDLARTWPTPDGACKVFEVTGTAYFLKPNSERSERFRVEAGREARQESLDLRSAAISSIQSRDDIEIFEGPVALTILEKGRHRAIRSGEVWVRRPGEPWQPFTGKAITAHGVFDISWRDPEADIQLERRRLVVVPVGAAVRGEMTTNVAGRITSELLSGWHLDLEQGNFVSSSKNGDSVDLAFTGRPSYRIDVNLRPPGGRPVRITVPMKCREAAVIRHDGSVVSAGHPIDVTALRGAVTISPNPTSITISPKTAQSKVLVVRFTGEYPLAALKPAVEELLASMGDQDALLELEFVGESRLPIRLKRYRYDRPELVDGTIVFKEPFKEMPVARMILDPAKEHLLQRLDETRFRLPERCSGPCLVYLRDGPDVVSRPLVLDAPGQLVVPTSCLMQALNIASMSERQSEISIAVGELETANADGNDLQYLISLVAGLNGLPATAFDVLKEISRRPRALIRLLISAGNDASRHSVWALQEQLPFLWLCFGATDWRDMLRLEWEILERSLAMLEPSSRSTLILEHFNQVREKLTTIEPALDVLFAAAGFPAVFAGTSLDTIVQAFIREQRMRDDDDIGSAKPARNVILEQLERAGVLLPAEFLRFSVAEFEGIAAPAALAATARGLFKPDAATEIALRKSLRENPGYVSSAYPHFLNYYGVSR